MVGYLLKTNVTHLTNILIQPQKKNKLDIELKKKNTEAAKNIVNMLNVVGMQDVVSTVNVNSLGTIDSNEIDNFNDAATGLIEVAGVAKHKDNVKSAQQKL